MHLRDILFFGIHRLKKRLALIYMNINSRKDLVFLVLAGLFITNALLGEFIGGKIFQFGPFTMSLGVLPWPIVFLTTDLINEYFGKEGVKRLTLITVGLIIYAFIILFAGLFIPAVSFSPVKDDAYSAVFGQSLWIIVGSIVAFMSSQLIDVFVFWYFRGLTHGRKIWLRATGSTAISQLVDTFVVMSIAFWLPGKMSFKDFLNTSTSNYSYKLMIAIASTPIIYIGHTLIQKFLGEHSAHQMAENVAKKNELQNEL